MYQVDNGVFMYAKHGKYNNWIQIGTIWSQHLNVTDRRTDGRTDGRLAMVTARSVKIIAKTRRAHLLW